MITMIEDRKEMEQILNRALVGRLGLSGDEGPYVVPINFVYRDGSIYFHCGLAGRKIEMMSKDPRVCFEVDELLDIALNDQPCLTAAHYYSVIAEGSVRFVEDVEGKKDALDLMMKKYGSGRQFEQPPENAYFLVNIGVIQVDRMTAKASLPDE